MALLKQWRDMAYDEKANKGDIQRFWANYFNIEKGIYEQLHNQQLRFIARSLHDMTLSERSYQEHKAICEQLAAGDAAAAEQAVRRHYASLRQYYVHLLISKDYRA